MTAISPAARRETDAAGLFERYGAQLYRFCLGRLRSPEEAEDAVQNVFLRVHTALRKGVVPEFEAAWLYKIAHNVCLSRIESRGRRAAFETPRDLDDVEYLLAAPEHDHDALDGLPDALAGLPHNLRQALLLREWQGLSQTEIADAMGTTVSAVETLLYRARRQLAATLEQGGRRARRVVAGLFDVLGLRALVQRLFEAASGAAPGSLAAGAAALVLGGSGIGTAVLLGTTHGPARAPAPAQHRDGRTPSPRLGTPAVGHAAIGGATPGRSAGAAVSSRPVTIAEPRPSAPARRAAAPSPPAQSGPGPATPAKSGPTLDAPAAPALPVVPVPPAAPPLELPPQLPAPDAPDPASALAPAVGDATAATGSAADAVGTATSAAQAAAGAVAHTAQPPAAPSLPVPALGG
ncbi:MAG TPA: RNA polymerase sigma factor [Gaiellaceae bacterium]|nr:RNA polymerase sigma factor [Gaiellaceae bacterium]